MRLAAAAMSVGVALGLAVPAYAAPSEPGVVNYAVLGKGSVGNIVGSTMRWENFFNEPFQGYWVDLAACNNWADIGLPEVYLDPDLASFNGAETKESATDETHFVKQAVGVFATNDAADRAFHRVVDRTVGCAGQTTAMHFADGTTQVWSFSNGLVNATDAEWVKQEIGAAGPATSGSATDRRCFTQTRRRENVLLQAKVCQSGNGGPAVNALAGAMQNSLGQ